MGGVKVFLLSGGTIDADRAVIVPGDDSRRRVTLPVMQVLLQGNGKSILVDTGLPPVAAGDPDGLKREFGMESSWMRPQVSTEERIDRQLAMLDLRVADLDMVINTHFHFDHAGGNCLVAGVPIAVQAAEVEAAQTSNGYLPVWDAPGVQFQIVEGDWSPMEGVEMLFTPGHSPGHQSMLVRTAAKPWLFTWDAVYTEEHWRADKLGAVWDVRSARSSMQRLREIAEAQDAVLIFGHDIGQWESLGMAGAGRPRLVAGNRIHAAS